MLQWICLHIYVAYFPIISLGSIHHTEILICIVSLPCREGTLFSPKCMGECLLSGILTSMQGHHSFNSSPLWQVKQVHVHLLSAWSIWERPVGGNWPFPVKIQNRTLFWASQWSAPNGQTLPKRNAQELEAIPKCPLLIVAHVLPKWALPIINCPCKRRVNITSTYGIGMLSMYWMFTGNLSTGFVWEITVKSILSAYSLHIRWLRMGKKFVEHGIRTTTKRMFNGTRDASGLGFQKQQLNSVGITSHLQLHLKGRPAMESRSICTSWFLWAALGWHCQHWLLNHFFCSITDNPF